jgi:hypothetical protein
MTAALVALALAAASAVQPPPAMRRATLVAMEKIFDGSLERTGGDDPLMVLGGTCGIYLEGYGAVFTAQVNLITSPGLSPFRLSMSPEDVARIHLRKLRHVPLLKQAMREMLLHSARTLDTVPLTEQIVVGVSLFYFSWEDAGGLPSQIVMRAQRGSLLQKTGAEGAIQTEEY